MSVILLAKQAVLVVAIGVGISGGLLAWRERPEPGALPLAILLAGQCWWSAAVFFQTTATGVSEKALWVDISWPGVAILPIAWLFFCLSYTGYNRYLRIRYVALASVVPVLTAVLGVTNDVHSLMYTGSELVNNGGYLTLDRTPGPWFWVSGGYTYLLGLLGAIPLLRFVTSDVDTFRGQSAALLLGLFAPWVTNVVHLAGQWPTGGVDPTPVAFSVSALAFLGALTRFQLLSTSPAPIRPARQSVLQRMEEGIIVLDRRNNIVDLNHRAAAVLETASTSPLGNPIDTVIPQFEAVASDQSQSGQGVIRPDDTHTYDISVSEVTDVHGRTAGQIVSLHDISEYLRQQQRLEVLNRVFRHNIRTNIQIIVSQVDYLATHNSEQRAETVQENALDIEQFSDNIREVLDVFERGRQEPEPVRLDTIIYQCVDSTETNYPDVTVHRDSVPDALHVHDIMNDVLSNVIENAAQHNTNPDPEVWVDAERTDGRVQITVEDNGPGINEEEIALLRRGTETQLDHGTGLGLAVVVWGTELIGGSVEFADSESGGTVVTLDVPVLSGASDTRDQQGDGPGAGQ
jgi:signal transduction histidine kinase